MKVLIPINSKRMRYTFVHLLKGFCSKMKEFASEVGRNNFDSVLPWKCIHSSETLLIWVCCVRDTVAVERGRLLLQELKVRTGALQKNKVRECIFSISLLSDKCLPALFEWPRSQGFFVVVVFWQQILIWKKSTRPICVKVHWLALWLKRISKK